MKYSNVITEMTNRNRLIDELRDRILDLEDLVSQGYKVSNGNKDKVNTELHLGSQKLRKKKQDWEKRENYLILCPLVNAHFVKIIIIWPNVNNYWD